MMENCLQVRQYSEGSSNCIRLQLDELSYFLLYYGMLLLYGSDQHQGKYDIDGTGCYQNRTSESSTDCPSEVLVEKY